jgi:uncharacterized protein
LPTSRSRGSREGILFVNHEYPDPFFLHGYKPTGAPKTPAQVQEEQDNVGNSIVHIRRRGKGRWRVVSASAYNRRIYGDRPDLEFTGPLAGRTGIGASAHGSVGNCSGGITPWGTALSCEENFDGYGTNVALNLDFGYGWHQFGGQPEDAESQFTNFKKYGWVCEHDPYDPDSVGRKHTALGRFRHENTAFRHEPGKQFVRYMGDDKGNEGVYKFVSDRRFRPDRSADNRRILESGRLFIARWEPEGGRRFRTAGDTTPISRLNGPNEYAYHENNAMFMVPTSGPNRGIAFRFANGPVECEITGPYFTPDEETLFANLQHPGETTRLTATAPGVFCQETTYTSWWPEGNKTAGDLPSTPRPSTVVITRGDPNEGEDD